MVVVGDGEVVVDVDDGAESGGPVLRHSHRLGSTLRGLRHSYRLGS